MEMGGCASQSGRSSGWAVCNGARSDNDGRLQQCMLGPIAPVAALRHVVALMRQGFCHPRTPICLPPGLQDSSKPKRPDYKFHKKRKQGKGSRGKGAYGINADGAGDGLGVAYGKKGGIVR